MRQDDPYLEEHQLNKLGNRLAGLDLSSQPAELTPPASSNISFLRPVAASALTELLGARGPRNRDSLPLSGRQSVRDSNYAAARDLVNFDEKLLTEDCDMRYPNQDEPPIPT